MHDADAARSDAVDEPHVQARSVGEGDARGTRRVDLHARVVVHHRAVRGGRWPRPGAVCRAIASQ